MMESFSDRRAEAICFVASYDGAEYTISSGKVSGKIADESRGENGFGWDKIFIPDGSDKTYGEMSLEEKNVFSMRKIAFENY